MDTYRTLKCTCSGSNDGPYISVDPNCDFHGKNGLHRQSRSDSRVEELLREIESLKARVFLLERPSKTKSREFPYTRRSR